MGQIIVLDDLVAPVLTSPVDTKTGSSTANLSVSTNKDNGTLYWIVNTSASTPSSATVIAGTGDANGSGSVTALGVQEFAATGLAGSTLYYAHFVHVDVSGNISNVANGDGFTTDSAGDTTAPVLTSPTDVAASTTTGTLGVTTDEGNGTLYWVVTTSNTAPSKAQVKAGQDHTGAAAAYADSTLISSTGVKSKTATGLSAGTQYYMHAMHEDAATNQSNVVSGDGFLTVPANETLTTLSSSPWTVPDAAAIYKLTVTVYGGGGGGAGGQGGQGGNGEEAGTPHPPDPPDPPSCNSGDIGANGSSGAAGGQSKWNVTVIANGGGGGTSSTAGANGTASGGDTNTTGGHTSSKGLGGDGGVGGGGGPSCGDGGDGSDGKDGGNGAKSIKAYNAGTFTPASTIAFVVGAKGNGGNGGNGGTGGSGDVSGDDGGDGDAGTAGVNGRIELAWSLS